MKGDLRDAVQCLNCGFLGDHDSYEQNIIDFILFAKNTWNHSNHMHVHYAGTDIWHTARNSASSSTRITSILRTTPRPLPPLLLIPPRPHAHQSSNSEKLAFTVLNLILHSWQRCVTLLTLLSSAQTSLNVNNFKPFHFFIQHQFTATGLKKQNKKDNLWTVWAASWGWVMTSGLWMTLIHVASVLTHQSLHYLMKHWPLLRHLPTESISKRLFIKSSALSLNYVIFSSSCVHNRQTNPVWNVWVRCHITP